MIILKDYFLTFLFVCVLLTWIYNAYHHYSCHIQYHKICTTTQFHHFLFMLTLSPKFLFM